MKSFDKALPALKSLKEAVQDKAKKTQSLKGLDGGSLYVRSSHSALNTLLQSAGAIIAKFWIVEAVKAYDTKGWIHGKDYIMRAIVHDEIQSSVHPTIVKEFGDVTIKAIEIAGNILGLKCPITGEYKVGRTWADCH